VSAEGFRYLLTVIDRTSRWPEVVPLKSISAERCADAFVESWVARYGVPHTVTSDRGTQFSSSAWACLAKKLGFRHAMTTAYHPQANGMVERLRRQLKDALRARQCGAAWLDHLPWVVLGLRAAPKDDSAVSAAEVVFGGQLVLPNQLPVRPDPVLHSTAPTFIPLRARSNADAVKGPARLLQEARFVYGARGAAVDSSV
jgi:Integrase core domain